MTTDVQNKRPRPLLALMLWQTISVVMTLLGLMSATQTRIDWRLWLGDVTQFYQRHVSEPLRQICAGVVHALEKELETDLSWLLLWFPEYLPIASAFFVGFVAAYSYVADTTPLGMVWRFFRDEMGPAFRIGLGEGLKVLGAGLLLTGGFFLISPAFFIVVPLLFVAAIVLVAMFYYGLLLLLVRYVVPFALLGAAVWFLVSRASFLSALERIRARLKNGVKLLRTKAPIVARKAWLQLQAELTGPESDLRRELRFWRRLIFWQYVVAALLGLLFLLIVGVNYSLSGQR